MEVNTSPFALSERLLLSQPPELLRSAVEGQRTRRVARLAAFFLHGVAEEAGDAVKRARKLQDLRENWHQRLAQARASALLMRLVDTLFDRPILTIPQAQRLLNVTYRSAQRNVEKLIQAGILQPVSDTVYGRTYIANEIIDVIRE